MRGAPWLFVMIAGTTGCSTLLSFDDVAFDAGTGSAADAGVADGAGDVEADSPTDGGAGGTGGETGSDAGGTGGAHDAQAEPATGPCDGITCSSLGTCRVGDGGQAVCDCPASYHAAGLACVADETCAGVDCGRCGTCEVLAGVATCTCPSGFKHDGAGCITDPNPCDTASCTSDQVCVPEAHCMPLGACVQKCDCSNCGNCGGDNTDGRWNDWQEYCGAEPNQSPALVACSNPCPPGEGCLPYSTPMCWPMEGCFSL